MLKTSDIIIYRRNRGEFLSDNLHTDEVDCKCGKDICTHTIISSSLVNSFQATRNVYGKKITVNSGYRCQSHNYSVGGGKQSKHLMGHAIDLTPTDGLQYLNELENLAEMYFDVVLRYDTFIHCHNRRELNL